MPVKGSLVLTGYDEHIIMTKEKLCSAQIISVCKAFRLTFELELFCQINQNGENCEAINGCLNSESCVSVHHTLQKALI